MGLMIYSHCDLDYLGRCFCQDVYNHIAPGESLFRKETVVVPSSGMSAWLFQKIAAESEIAGNLKFPFINGVVKKILSLAFPDSRWDLSDGFLPERNAFSREELTWKIFRELQNSPQKYPLFCRYFDNGEKRESKLFQLSETISSVLDSYQVYSPELLHDWLPETEKNNLDFYPENHGSPLLEQQQDLYDAITGEQPGMNGFLSRFIQGDFPDPERFRKAFNKCYNRLTFFGFSAMPHIYYRFICKLAEYGEIRLFHVNSAILYWGDQYDRNEFRSRLKKTMQYWNQGESGVSIPELLPYGSPLLQAFGQQGRVFLEDILNSLDDPSAQVEEAEKAPFFLSDGENIQHATLLERLQSDIRMVREKAGEPMSYGEFLQDNSLEVHSCYNALREVEMIHDRVLDALQDPDMEARDIVIMAPDINGYLPFIEAVFGNDPRLAHLFTVSDRNLKTSGVMINVFLKTLSVCRKQMTVQEVFDILSCENVYKKFRLEAEDLPLLKTWIRKAGIRWGIGPEHRREITGTAFKEYSWSAGLERLLLGYAMIEPGTPDDMYAEEIQALDFAEDSEPVILGNFLQFFRLLEEIRENILSVRKLPDWIRYFLLLLDRLFFYSPAIHQEMNQVRVALVQLLEIVEKEKIENLFDIETTLDVLSSCFDMTYGENSFFRGKITFCSMVPMRTIPCKFIAVMGLNEADFPRREKNVTFSFLPDE